MRTSYNLNLFWRSTIGFDRLFDLVDAAQQQAGTEDNYPALQRRARGRRPLPYLACAHRLLADEIDITAERSVLTVEGRKAEKQQRELLHQGISWRPFNLADYVQVKGTAFDSGFRCPSP